MLLISMSDKNDSLLETFSVKQTTGIYPFIRDSVQDTMISITVGSAG